MGDDGFCGRKGAREKIWSRRKKMFIPSPEVEPHISIRKKKCKKV
jgi:hypothetical protein